jgi:ATP-dependent helicase/nuclease subunit A
VSEAAAALSHAARDALAQLALADFDAPVGRAYSHFAVELDWKAFQDLLALIETDRVKLADYTARVVAGTADGPHALVGADPDVTVEALEQDFMRWLDRDQWQATAAARKPRRFMPRPLAAGRRHGAPHAAPAAACRSGTGGQPGLRRCRHGPAGAGGAAAPRC